MIFLDIETIPTERPDVIEKLQSTLKAPSNYKDQTKIKAYIEEHKNEVVNKTALSGLFGQVLCIGFAGNNDQPADALYRETENLYSEKELLAIFREKICNPKTGWCDQKLIGHNSIKFDVPFLSQRMMINGLPPLFRHGLKPWDVSVEDTMELFACGSRNYYSLDDLCLAFGIESPKTDLDGSRVYEYYKSGRHIEIEEYCKRDVEATREVYRCMTIQKAT